MLGERRSTVAGAHTTRSRTGAPLERRSRETKVRASPLVEDPDLLARRRAELRPGRVERDRGEVHEPVRRQRPGAGWRRALRTTPRAAWSGRRAERSAVWPAGAPRRRARCGRVVAGMHDDPGSLCALERRVGQAHAAGHDIDLRRLDAAFQAVRGRGCSVHARASSSTAVVSLTRFIALRCRSARPDADAVCPPPPRSRRSRRRDRESRDAARRTARG